MIEWRYNPFRGSMGLPACGYCKRIQHKHFLSDKHTNNELGTYHVAERAIILEVLNQLPVLLDGLLGMTITETI